MCKNTGKLESGRLGGLVAMNQITLVLEQIIKQNSTLSPVIIVDPNGIFEEFLKDREYVNFIENPSRISLTMAINSGSASCVYIEEDADISGFVSSGKIKILNITPEMILNQVNELHGSISGMISLIPEQYKIFLHSFESICEVLQSYEEITSEIILNTILKHISGSNQAARKLLISVFNEELTMEELIDAELLQQFVKVVRDELGIHLECFSSYKNMFSRVMISYSKYQYDEIGGTVMSDLLLNIEKNTLWEVQHFILENADSLTSAILHLNEICKDITPSKMTYALPRLFVKYVGMQIDNYKDIHIVRDLLWTDEMKLVGDFVIKSMKLDILLNNNVNFFSEKDTLDQLWFDYKNNLSDIDMVFREVEACDEKLALIPEFYLGTSAHDVMEDLKVRYHNVIRNTNSHLFRYYEQEKLNCEHVIKQSKFMDDIIFAKRTVFIFADGFRYEMAKSLKKMFKGYKIDDYDVLGELPSETEIGMNSYFIQDEHVRLNEKNAFSLEKEEKPVFQIYNWRQENLAKKLDCGVITFQDFIQNKDYSGSVICFFDEADINMHHYNSASKMSEAIMNIEKIIRYSLERQFDVVLLSDHGYVDIQRKIDLQDKSIVPEKKKSRYLILIQSENVDATFYSDKIKGADYLKLEDRKLCFINSTNSLRETSRYTHGGISLQENVITALRFYGAVEEKKTQHDILFEMLKAYNKLTGRIKGAAGYSCNILSGTDVVFTVMIDVEDYQLHVPIRQYEPGTDFLVMVSKGDVTEKVIVKKEGGRVVDKDLDIFS